MRRLRRIFRPKYVLRFMLITSMIWLLVMLGLGITAYFYGEQDQTQTADVIIVLGSGLRRDGRPGAALSRRSAHAAELWQEGYAPVILCTGGQGQGQATTEAAGCRDVLLTNGVPANVIHLEAQSRSTEENALFSHVMMQEQGWEDALLVTDSFHMLRANWIFNAEGIVNYPAPVPLNQLLKRTYFTGLGREIIALQWQALKETLNLPVTYVPIG
ncbi:MAG: YdcF family protein [Anaerolineae bacterium]|nr:YdcF family protein [Anaerolineae bacterium]